MQYPAAKPVMPTAMPQPRCMKLLFSVRDLSVLFIVSALVADWGCDVMYCDTDVPGDQMLSEGAPWSG